MKSLKNCTTMVDFCTTIKPTAESTDAGFVNKIQVVKDYSPSTGASSSSLTMVSISPDFSPVLVFTKKYFMKIFGAAALGAPCLLS